MQISRSNKRSSHQRQRGFTLIEVILVLVLMGLAMGLVASIISRSNDGARLRQTAQQLGLALRELRTEALRSQVTQAFKLYPSKHLWLAGAQTAHEFDVDIRTKMTSGRELSDNNSEGVIVFYPDGASSGGAIELSLGDQNWRTDVNWISGAVSLSREGVR